MQNHELALALGGVDPGIEFYDDVLAGFDLVHHGGSQIVFRALRPVGARLDEAARRQKPHLDFRLHENDPRRRRDRPVVGRNARI
ncbi:hypothetical protein DDZ18_10870 [Marinicauda salina]|uniref:Uncharacterized protein n=1 Tax=Marinicauda salina TaxID=2135793 RepID=A0A2U2BRR1_9PROT|nr:hypothetical protein DDZ18_10870 [Marinicauda salina]